MKMNLIKYYKPIAYDISAVVHTLKDAAGELELMLGKQLKLATITGIAALALLATSASSYAGGVSYNDYVNGIKTIMAAEIGAQQAVVGRKASVPKKNYGNGGIVIYNMATPKSPPGLDGETNPGYGGTPPGHGGIPPGQAKKDGGTTPPPPPF